MSYETSLLTLMAGNLWPWLVFCLLFGYVLGSIPFGLLLTRAAGLGDVRKIGSGNIGATNVLRTGNKTLALATLVLDALKGTAAVMLADYRYGQGGAAFAALGAFIGHLYPIWLGFRGGKGVATYIGVLLGLLPAGAAAFCGTWLIAVLATRYSSVGALAAAVAAPLALFLLEQKVLAVLTLIMTLLLFWKHRGNIGRLIRGAEPKIGARA